MSTRNHPNPEALFPKLKRHEVLLLAEYEKGWVSSNPLLAIDDATISTLLAHWDANGLLERRDLGFTDYHDMWPTIEYRATRSGKFVVKGWREAGWIE